jgi:two-component system phosphate regulon sensor histidine kinase PhoR
MNKRLFILLVLLMSLSLIGIIFIQAYYINSIVKNEEQQFTFNVKKALSYVSNSIEDKEYRDYFQELEKVIAEGRQPDTTSIRGITVYRQDDDANELIIYRNRILEENFRIPSFIDIGLDSVRISRIFNKSETNVYSTNTIDGSLNYAPEKSFLRISRMTDRKSVV